MSEHCHSNCGCYTLINGALWDGDCALPAALEAIRRLREVVKRTVKYDHHFKLCDCALCKIVKETEQYEVRS